MRAKTFVLVTGVSMDCEYSDENPNMMPDASDGGKWNREASHWKITLALGDKTFETYFSLGSGHKGREPEIEEVLECLALDCQCVGGDFEDFCSNCGYDSDSRKAEKIWKTIERQSNELQDFFGNRFDDFLAIEG